MENSDSAQCVRVAVNIRPLITSELMLGCTDCISLVPGEPQVQIGSHAFTYDYVYSSGSPSSTIYDDCVAPLVDALFHGYNATVLAYGQTGSGKTYTMGTNYTGEDNAGGIIPKVMETTFKRVQTMKESSEFLIRVSFIEIFKEEVFDLLDHNSSRGDVAPTAKPAVPSRVPIQIRETVNGGITLAGVTEAEVKTKEEMSSYLSRGSLSRATGSTNMNSQSSRSHAIFTITMEQKSGDDVLCAKLHLVDLAGSERAKRTGADGMRLKEGIHINKGLLALGNVISALGDERKRKEGGHVPYRDSKLTRLLQDSLGGNSKTVMIACVSPADTNAEETLNTLKYANRARNIQNKAVINRDPVGAQMQRMRSQIEQLQSELLLYRGDAGGAFEELQILKQKISLLEASNEELQQELQERRVTCESLSQRACDAQVEKDQLIMKIESIRNGKSWDEIDSNSNQDYDLVKSYVSKIQDLEGELRGLKNLNAKSRHVDWVDSDDSGFRSKNVLFACANEYSSDCDAKSVDITDDMEDHAKEIEHSSLQEKLDRELKELDKKLEQKEAEMKMFNNSDTSVLKHHYEKKVLELEQEKKFLQKEIEELKYNLANISSSSGDGAQKLKEEYLQKLNALEAQVSVLKKKQESQAQLLRQKQKSDEAAKRLQDEIQRIKSHKVQLQHKIKQESEQFRLWKASREKEVLQLKKEGRRNEYEMHKLLALNQRQKMVLQRKTEEATLATKRLKELLESRKTSRESAAGGNGPGIQALMQAIEHELEVTVRVHEVRSAHERQMEERAKMANEIARLKEEADMMKLNNSSDGLASMSPGARNSRIYALEKMIATSSTTLLSMASQLSEAEERERIFSGKGRWNQVRSLPEAKNLMNHLFNLASSSRCLLRDKEVTCREKGMEIRDLKEKVVRLSCSLRQLEMQKSELIHQLKLLSAKRYSESLGGLVYPDINGGHKYDLRKMENRRSTILLEDMDLSVSDTESDDYVADATDDEWVASEKIHVRKRKSRSRHVSMENNQSNISSEDVKDNSTEGVGGASGETVSDICCSCSKSSSCKTNKCKCRTLGGICGSSCGCLASKCANRASGSNESPVEGTGNDSSIQEADKDHLLAAQGAELLQGALIGGPAEAHSDHGPRKPLSDIGNTLAKSNAQKPNQRREWKNIKRKSTLSTVVLNVVPPTSSQSDNSEVPKKENNSISEANVSNIPQKMHSSRPENVPVVPKVEKNVIEPDIRLPRAMRKSVSPNGGGLPLGDMNASKPDEPVNKESEVMIEARTPVKQKRTLEKENNGR
ncbi:kinesin-like protein KIN-4C [Glycine soja]|uniref:Kinesin-like protein KIN-4C isoform A n=1 Tax=Glycine soja TaxID=3848 RepID=A0A445H7E7_GLYSO|nr:kinesin-like protein KIN-4C [Glycine soja]XP_028198316.1 kinesin-like protein KIN-4C [Glycine soja]XP_028198317.1 kinesin-like protein KIN-4C [Glycine soja]RZB69616.1 Kinesin-like protein KIN-4C isoform A [Glycine soja]RZB69617.1 Kinesin-like protein KIN-4C isoform B [Glycine soja]RZB69618.1 Kinesin-like protein KIN-4C isoform C [Glycine soja]RZB69619.1 Kinesin-like protein KIN-4C isoform D [Glycine soja]